MDENRIHNYHSKDQPSESRVFLEHIYIFEALVAESKRRATETCGKLENHSTQ